MHILSHYLSPFLFPEQCVGCKVWGSLLCARCQNNQLLPTHPECYICRKVSGQYKTHIKCRNKGSPVLVFVKWRYNALGKKLLRVYKYNYVRKLSAIIAELIQEDFKALAKLYPELVIMPIPLHRGKENLRGYNQCAEIVKDLTQNKQLLANQTLARRIRTTRTQAGLSKEDRIKNMHKCFEIDNRELARMKDKTICIFDDVLSSGSTIESLCSTIYKLNPQQSVIAYCLFRGKPRYTANL